MDIETVIERMKVDENFMLQEPSGIPHISENYVLPDEVIRFYTLCGGIECFVNGPAFPIRILSPGEVVNANLSLLGEEFEDDISSNWHLIADAYDGNYICLDCGRKHNGACIEGFEETYALRDDSPIIAKSFTEFLENLLKYAGDRFFWLEDEFEGYGDAYQ